MDHSEFIYGYYFNEDNQKDQDNKIKSLSSVEKDRSFWLHFDYTQETTKQWLTEQSQLNPVVITALLNEETRPRATPLNGGVLMSLRGVNLAPNSDPHDMVSIRLWFAKDKIISTRFRTLLSTKDIAADFDNNEGPKTPSEFITILTENLITRMGQTIYEIEESVSDIEENILTSSTHDLRNELSDLRRQIISLRRYLSPQREAMSQLFSDKISLFTNEEKILLRETSDHLTRYIEDLDSIKDRAIVCQEELNHKLNDQMNNRMFVLSVVAAVFLPLGFLTGLLGINVGGIPGSDNSNAFSIFILILIVVVILQVWVFKKKKWF